MNLVDTHCHIFSDDYALDADKVIIDAAAVGVKRLICVGTTPNDSEQAVSFVQNRSGCWATIGLHPHDAKLGQEAFGQMRTLAHSPKSKKIVGIGECGLDYFYGHSSREDQIAALHFQIQLALANDLPLVFHVRDAFDDFWPIFDSYKNIRGVVHSFTDSQENLDMALARELYIGVNGIATFTKNAWQLEVYRRIPMENLVLETDAPFLTPAPLRGKVNQSAYVSHICTFLATLRGEDKEVLAEKSTHNAITLFQLYE